MEKKLRRWGNVSLFIAIVCFAVFFYRNDRYDIGFDTINTWLFCGIVGGLLGGMTLKSIASFKKIKEEEAEQKAEAE